VAISRIPEEEGRILSPGTLKRVSFRVFITLQDMV
jgi:hypothetical protein